MNKKKKLVIFVFFIVILFLVIIKIFGTKRVDEKIKEYISVKGFSQVDESTMYKKELSNISIDSFFENSDKDIDSEYSVLYFDVSNYVLSKINMGYSNDVYTYFSSKYDYTDDALHYEYELTKDDKYINLSGNYDINSKEFSCLVNSYKNMNKNEGHSVFCDKVKYDVLDFSVEIYDVINDMSLIDKLKKDKNH